MKALVSVFSFRPQGGSCSFRHQFTRIASKPISPLEILEECIPSPRWIFLHEGVIISKNDQPPFRSSHGDIQSTSIMHEAKVAPLAATYQGYEDEIFLISLRFVDASDPSDSNMTRSQLPLNLVHLSCVWLDDTNRRVGPFAVFLECMYSVGDKSCFLLVVHGAATTVSIRLFSATRAHIDKSNRIIAWLVESKWKISF